MSASWAEFPKLNIAHGTDTNLKYALTTAWARILAEGNNFAKQIAGGVCGEARGQRLQRAARKLNAGAQDSARGGRFLWPDENALRPANGTRQFYQRHPTPT